MSESIDTPRQELNFSLNGLKNLIQEFDKEMGKSGSAQDVIEENQQKVLESIGAQSRITI